jgi:hypothetical protein
MQWSHGGYWPDPAARRSHAVDRWTPLTCRNRLAWASGALSARCPGSTEGLAQDRVGGS